MKMSKNEWIKLYNARIYKRFNHLQKHNIELDFYQLAYIFELYCCILLMNTYDNPILLYEDVPIDFKNEQEWSKQDTGVDFTDMISVLGQCKLRKNCNITLREISTFLSFVYFANELKTTNHKYRPVLACNDHCKIPTQFNKLKNIDKGDIIYYKIDELIQYCKSIRKPVYKQILYDGLRPYQQKCIDEMKNTKKTWINPSSNWIRKNSNYGSIN